MVAETPTVHASAVLAGARAVLIRGPAGAGKSKLALALIDAAQAGLLAFARLVGDDRVHLEVRGLGIRRLDHEPVAVVGLVVDLAADDAGRLPAGTAAVICGISLPRLAVAAGAEASYPLLARLRFPPGDIKPPS